MSAKNTQGELHAGTPEGERKERLFINGYAIAVCQVDERRLPTGEEIEIRNANAARLALCWNMHDEMAEALEEINNIIFAAGAPLGSENYFAIRTLCADLRKKLDSAP